MKKTNAIRLLEKSELAYETVEYSDQGDISGLGVAKKTGESPWQVFKTLVTRGKEGVYVFMLPSDRELDLKKAAQAAGAKKLDMLPAKDLFKTTGYVHGGCSPLAMKKDFPVFVDESALDLPYIYFSGGRVGLQIKLEARFLEDLIGAKFLDIK